MGSGPTMRVGSAGFRTGPRIRHLVEMIQKSSRERTWLAVCP